MFSYMGVSENRGPEYSTLNSRILIKGSNIRYPPFSETPIQVLEKVGYSGLR